MPLKLRSSVRIWMAAFVLICSANAATITDAALAAWNESVQQARDRLTSQPPATVQFLIVDQKRDQPEHLSSGVLSIVSPHSKGLTVAGGLIHHWIGTVFIQNANVSDVIATLQNYDSYSALFQPALVHSKLLSRSGDTFLYRLKFVQKDFGISTAFTGDFRSTYSQPSLHSGYSITEAVRLEELRSPETPGETVVPFSASHGYIEKMFTVVRYREADGGTYVQVETLVLSRDIPAALRWFVNPLVKRFSQQTMAATLDRLRAGVTEGQSQNALIMAARAHADEYRRSLR